MLRATSRIPICRSLNLASRHIRTTFNPVKISSRHFWSDRKSELAPVKVSYLDSKKDIKTIDAINADSGLSRFIRTTYKFTGAGIGGTLVMSQMLSMVHSPEMFLPMFGTGIVMSLGGIFGMSYSKYTIHNERVLDKNNSKKISEHWYSKNSPGRLASYGALVAGMSMTLAPMVSIVNDISSTILPSSALITGFVFGGSILYAKLRPKGSLLAWEAPLMGGLMSLVGVSLVGLGSHLLFGPTMFSAALHSIDTYGGILLFTGMSAYDTHKSIEMYEKRNPDHLGCSVNLYLDFMNLLIRIMEVMAKAQKNK